MTWRVIDKLDADGLPFVTIADVLVPPQHGFSPFLRHDPPYPVATTVEELKRRMEDIMLAFERPVLRHRVRETLEETLEEKL